MKVADKTPVLLICLNAGLIVPACLAAGGIATDGSVGAATVLSGANKPNGNRINIPESLGSRRGGNLFHSFSDFNIQTKQTVTFNETVAGSTKNVISRVTGQSASTINGLLRVTPKGNANFYLINPNGVAFGKGSQVDVKGSLHLSTADEIRLSNGQKFSAVQPIGNSLSNAAPAAFGFLGTSTANNGLLAIDAAKLEVKDTKAIDLVAGNITVKNNATVNAPGGAIRFVARQGQGQVALTESLSLPTNKPTANNSGDITMTDSFFSDGKIDFGYGISVSGNGGGRLSMWGDSIAINNGSLLADNKGNANATEDQGVIIQARNFKFVDSLLTSEVESAGDGGKIRVTADNVELLEEGEITSFVAEGGKGKGGAIIINSNTITIDAKKSTEHSTGLTASLNKGSHGEAGSILIKTKHLNLFNLGEISSSTSTNKNAGDIAIETDNLTIDGNNANAVNSRTGIFSISDSGGNSNNSGGPGALRITVSNALLIKNNGFISAQSKNPANTDNINPERLEVKLAGKEGSIFIKTKHLSLLNLGEISSTTHADQDASPITVETDNLSIDGDNAAGLTGIFSRSGNKDHFQKNSGAAGDLQITVSDALQIKDHGEIFAITHSKGNAGNIAINADTLKIDGQQLATGIFSQAESGSSGQAGNISLKIRILELLNNLSFISSSSFGSGDAGGIRIEDAHLIRLAGSERFALKQGFVPFIGSKTFGNGRAGNVSIITKTLELDHSSNISTTTEGKGKAGTIAISADNLSIKNGGLISSASLTEQSSGQVGDIELTVSGQLALSGGKIRITNEANALKGNVTASLAPGSITANAKNAVLENSHIEANSTGNVAAGAINLRLAEMLTLNDSSITTSVAGTSGNGGNIDITAAALILETGLIQANTAAEKGLGGDINLNLKALIPSGNMLTIGATQPIDWQPGIFGANVIQAAAPSGLSGQIESSAPQLNLSGVLANFGAPKFETGTLSPDYCKLKSDSSLVRLGKGGLLPKAKDNFLY